MSKLPFPISSERLAYTDYDRIFTELVDLPYKPGYGKLFKVEVKSADSKDLLFPVLYVNYMGKFYPFQLILVGYPKFIKGYFLVVPPSPTDGTRHPHVFASGDVCWDLEKDWKPGMALYEDYILFLIRLLHHPEMHEV
jgi:hypothetical protein